MELESHIDKEKENVQVDIKPLTKWKRFLVFLSDFFINLIFTLILFNIAITPLGKLMTGFEKKNNNYISCTEKMNSVLYSNNLIFINPLLNKDYINENIEYTYDCFLSYYVLDSESSLMSDNHPQYGHKLENEIFYHYFYDIKNDEAKYISFFENYNNKHSYFTNQENSFSLKDNVKEELKPYFDPKDEMSSVGETYYQNIKNSVYVTLLSEVFSDIETNDLTYNGISYLAMKKQSQTIEEYHKNLLIVCSFVSYAISSLTCYLLIPLISKTRKTITMMFMKVEKINISRLYIARKWESAIGSLYSIFSNTSFILFIPITLVTFNYLFSMTALVVFTMSGLLFSLASLFVLLFNQFNRTLSDVLSYSVMISTDDLDAIYRARGYDI